MRSVSRFVKVGKLIINMEQITRITLKPDGGGYVYLGSQDHFVYFSDDEDMDRLVAHLDMADRDR